MPVSTLMHKSISCLLALFLLSLMGTGISHAAPSPLSGAETFSRNDLTIGKLFPITLSRRYSSNTGYDSPLGYGWAHNYDKRLYVYGDGSVVIRKETGWKRKFTVSAGTYTTPVGETGILVKNPDGTFTYTEKDGTSELYDLQGRLVTITAPNGSSLALTYIAPARASIIGLLPSNIDQNNPIEVARDYLLAKIEEKNPSGATTGISLTFTYNSSTGRLTGIIDNLGRTVTYTQDTIGNLTGVSTSLLVSTYGYTDSNNKHLITTTDEGSGIYTTTYDKSGRVTRQTHANGITDIEYTIPRQKTKVTTTIKDENSITLNTSIRLLEFDNQGQVLKDTDTLGNQTIYTRDSNTNITREEKWENIGTIATPSLVLRTATTNTYDPRNNQLSKTEAQGTILEKTTTWTYDPTNNKILTQTEKSVVNPATNKVTTNTYDTSGNLIQTTTTGLLGDGTPFSYTSTYTYDTNGKLKTIDGPRTDVSDITTNSYDTTGNLISVTPPLGGTTTYTNFDGLGNPQTVTDPNGAVTTYTYDTTGRVLTVKAPGDTQATQYSYSGGGCSGGCGAAASKIKSIILPEGNRIDYSYDANGNQSQITDNAGNSITYHYDSEGNKLKEEIKDTAGTLQKTLSYQYDALNRLTKVINPDNTFTQFGYDSRNNRTSSIDPRLNNTSYQYDTLSRLIATIQPGSISTGFGYDSNNNQISVTDPNTNTTSYSYDDMGRVYQTISPDTGTTTYSYDPAGNLKTKTDAKGITTSYSYDAANRLTTIHFPTDADTSYAYDTCINGKGRLCTLIDASGTTSYEYTKKGQIAKETRTIDGTAYVTQYSYDMNGNIMTMTYPSGRVIAYAYSYNKPASVRNNTANLATNIIYKPFGGITALTYGNTISETIGFDNQYRIASIIVGTILNLSYTDDTNGNITTIVNNLDSTKNKSYTYDALDRLTTANGAWGALSWTYDGIGNRKTEGVNTYNYQSNNNKLTSANGITFSYDTNGNTTIENTRQYTYNQNQRLIQAVDGSMTAGYTYNANGQRVKKFVNGITTIFHYNQSGQIVAESDIGGVITAEYVYLNGQPLAMIEGVNTYYYHNDHLGTPQRMTDSTGAIVWSADYKLFGDATIIGTVTNNLRFPGQYYDQETGLHYNYFRNYNPAIGRYVQADPIGIEGGKNHLFGYVQNNPIKFVDPFGLITNRTKCTISCNLALSLPCTVVGVGVGVIATPLIGFTSGMVCRGFSYVLCYQICPPPCDKK